MVAKGKRMKGSVADLELQELYPVDEAIAKMLAMPKVKFDESIDIAVRLGVDPKHADQMVRGACVLPHGTGKTVRVAVFAKG
jgi:large subunit ribosomal protein L1